METHFHPPAFNGARFSGPVFYAGVLHRNIGLVFFHVVSLASGVDYDSHAAFGFGVHYEGSVFMNLIRVL